MSQHQTSSALPLLLTFLAGAAIGAMVVALTTPKAGPRLREDLKALTRSGRSRPVEGLRAQGRPSRRTYVWHILGAKRDHSVSVDDLLG